MKNATIKESVYIPTTLKVGFKLRSEKTDRYTQDTSQPTYKIGFVSYYDAKGKFRYEISFENWRDKGVETEEHQNVPTNGFKFFKDANRSTWNHFSSYRNVALEVQDPRGWVFEINHSNLVWILDNCDVIKGELVGDFVYGWDGKDRVLIPCASAAYVEAAKVSETINNKGFIQPKELQLHHAYLSKQGERMIYVGKFKNYRKNIVSCRNGDYDFFLKEGYIRVGHNKDNLLAKCACEGNFYHFFVENKLVKIKNPRDKFLKDLGVVDSVEEITAERLRSVDFSKPFVRHLTKEDYQNFFNRETKNTTRNVLWTHSIEVYTDELKDFPTVCGLTTHYSKLSGEWKFMYGKPYAYTTDPRYVNLENTAIDLDEFIEKFKPYVIHYVYDNGEPYYLQNDHFYFFRKV